MKKELKMHIVPRETVGFALKMIKSKEELQGALLVLTKIVSILLSPTINLKYIERIVLTPFTFNHESNMPETINFEITTNYFCDSETKFLAQWSSNKLKIRVGEVGLDEWFDAKSPDEAAKEILKYISKKLEIKIKNKKKELDGLKDVKEKISKAG